MGRGRALVRPARVRVVPFLCWPMPTPTPASPKTPAPLSAAEVAEQLKLAPQWQVGEGPHAQLNRTYQFPDFVRAIAFVNDIAKYAEEAQHHPDMLVRYNKVTLSVNTHDAAPGGAVTQKDFDLARAADTLFMRMGV